MVTRTPNFPLVLIKWVDSAQPISGWHHLSDLKDYQKVISCYSVGWLIYDDNKIKMLAPNVGDPNDDNNIQGCGVMRIPTVAVKKIIKLKPPNSTD